MRKPFYRPLVQGLPLLLLLLPTLLQPLLPLRAQSNAFGSFSYQGRLNDAGGPATGVFEMTFSLHDAPSGGVQLGTNVVHPAVPVTSGYFQVLLQFPDASAFNGNARWLSIGVRPTGSPAAPTLLSPRQALTATPYALTAGNVSGSVSANQLSGILQPAQLPSGLVTGAVWRASGNAGANPATGAFLGTTDNLPLEVKVNSERALRLEPNSTSPNVIAGHAANIVSNGVAGGTIGGGGDEVAFNRVGGNYATVPGGRGNIAAGFASVALGNTAIALGDSSVAMGNTAIASGAWSVAIGSGTASGPLSTAMGGSSASGVASTAMGGGVAGGDFSTAMGLGATTAGTNAIAMGEYTWSFGYNSLAAGHFAQAFHAGTFVWADYTPTTAFPSTADNQFLIRATGGVGINTNNPNGAALAVLGNVTVDGTLSGDGSGLSNVNASALSGTIPSSAIAPGSITSAQLAPGTIPSTGQGSVLPGGIVMSDDANSHALQAAGYSRVPNAELSLVPEKWTQANPPAANTEFLLTGDGVDWSEVVVNTGSNLFVFRTSPRFSDIYLDFLETSETLIFNATTRTWSKGASPPELIGDGAQAVWTGSQVLLWGGRRQLPAEAERDPPAFHFSTKVLTYNPASDQWSSIIGTGAVPQGREKHTAIWTGSRLLIWGGQVVQAERDWTGEFNLSGVRLSGGALFDPANGTWTTISTNGGPGVRFGETAVWTGSRLIVHGGRRTPFSEGWGILGTFDENDMLNDGFSYNPVSNTWSPIRSDSSAPRISDARAVWTGTEMFLYGGAQPSFNHSLGEWIFAPTRVAWSYSPANDTWTFRGIPDLGAPIAAGRREHSLLWTGSEVLVVGGFGYDESQPLNELFLPFWFYSRTDVQAYNMAAGTWRTLPAAPPPISSVLGMYDPQAHWLVDRAVIFEESSRMVSYLPASNTWETERNYFGPEPLNPIDPSVVWTGRELIVWGGLNDGVPSNRGRRFSPGTGLWTEIGDSNAPAGRTRHSAVWTGSRMVVWGGDGGGDPRYPSTIHASGGAYDPLTDTWTALPNPPVDPVIAVPFARTGHKAVWTPYGMVVVGGSDGSNNQDQNFNPTIARLSPNLSAWTLAPGVGRFGHCLGTDGSRRVFLWGGQEQTDSEPIGFTTLIDAANLTFSLMSDADQPEPARNSSVVWSGTEFIVWGGTDPSHQPLRGGGRFSPANGYWTQPDFASPAITTPHAGHAALWSGTEMLIWGGTTNVSGARYNPRNDGWTPMSTGPAMRTNAQAVWTGTNMLLYLPALAVPGSIPELWRYQPPVKTYLYLKL